MSSTEQESRTMVSVFTLLQLAREELIRFGTEADAGSTDIYTSARLAFELTNEALAVINERASVDDIIRERNNWEDCAAQHCRNMEYYRGLVDRIGASLGDDAYIADDGSRSDDILRAKVPDLVEARLKTKTPSDNSEKTDALALLRALMTNPHINLGDQIYQVREREGQGWEGPSVKAWSDAVVAATELLKNS